MSKRRTHRRAAPRGTLSAPLRDAGAPDACTVDAGTAGAGTAGVGTAGAGTIGPVGAYAVSARAIPGRTAVGLTASIAVASAWLLATRPAIALPPPAPQAQAQAAPQAHPSPQAHPTPLAQAAPQPQATPLASPSPQTPTAPRRIVSLNLCTDQLLLDLVPPERIAGLSALAIDPQLSTVATRARAFPLLHGSAEEVLARDPDLILTAEHASPATVDLLRRLGRRVVTIPLAEDFDGIRASIRAVAAAVGEPAHGDALVTSFDQRLAALTAQAAQGQTATPQTTTAQTSQMSAPPSARPTALSWEINALSAGAATLIDAAMTAAGLDNLARSTRLGRGGQLPLEMIIAHPPDILVLANAADDYRTVAADNLAHPALAKAMRGRQTLHIGMPLWLCGSPRTLDAVERLVAVRAAVLAAAASTRHR